MKDEIEGWIRGNSKWLTFTHCCRALVWICLICCDNNQIIARLLSFMQFHKITVFITCFEENNSHHLYIENPISRHVFYEITVENGRFDNEIDCRMIGHIIYSRSSSIQCTRSSCNWNESKHNQNKTTKNTEIWSTTRIMISNGPLN